MYDDISDSHLSSIYKTHLNRTVNTKTKSLKNLRLCSTSCIRQPGVENTVYVIADEEHARYGGLQTCRSSWACPICTPKVMARKASEIADLIDYMATKKNLYAFMITFTLPHNKYMPANETFDVLQKVWRKFSKAGSTNKRTLTEYRQTKTKGERKYTYEKTMGVFPEFRAKYHIDYFVRAYEFTWSAENGWHPHIHCLFFAEKKYFKYLAKHQQELTDDWFAKAKRSHKKWLQQHNQERDLDELYSEWRKNPKTGHRSVYFSKDKTGKVRVFSSSAYLAGWGGNSELTKENRKTGRKNGHYSPFQLLELADKAESVQEANRWFNLFDEYALATKGRNRINMTKECKKFIEEWRLTNEWIERFKKKVTEKAVEKQHVVFWFTELQWQNICMYETELKINLKSKILELAILKNPEIEIINFLKSYDIDVSSNLTRTPKSVFYYNRYVLEYNTG